MIRYEDYRFVARVDWIDIRISLVQPTQSRYLLKDLATLRCAASHVDPANKSPSNTDAVWTLRFQDPHSARSVRRDLEELQQTFKFATAPEVTGLEVSFDAYADAADANVVEMAEHMFRGLAEPPSSNRRITGPKGTTGLVESALESRRGNLRALAAGKTVHIGNQRDDRSVRVYVKENVDGRHARLENTFRGGAIPFATLDAWQQFDFRKLSWFFRWRRRPDTVNAQLAVILDYPPALAAPPSALARRQHRRINKVFTVADRDLNREARRALGKLTTEQRRRK